MIKMEKGEMELRTIAVFMKTEEVLNHILTASGVSQMDIIKQLDAETGAVIGECIDLCSDIKDIAVIQAKYLDKTLKELDVLKRMNSELCKQNEELRGILRGISENLNQNNRKIKNSSKKDWGLFALFLFRIVFYFYNRINNCLERRRNMKEKEGKTICISDRGLFVIAIVFLSVLLSIMISTKRNQEQEMTVFTRDELKKISQLQAVEDLNKSGAEIYAYKDKDGNLMIGFSYENSEK